MIPKLIRDEWQGVVWLILLALLIKIGMRFAFLSDEPALGFAKGWPTPVIVAAGMVLIGLCAWPGHGGEESHGDIYGAQRFIRSVKELGNAVGIDTDRGIFIGIWVEKQRIKGLLRERVLAKVMRLSFVGESSSWLVSGAPGTGKDSKHLAIVLGTTPYPVVVLDPAAEQWQIVSRYRSEQGPTYNWNPFGVKVDGVEIPHTSLNLVGMMDPDGLTIESEARGLACCIHPVDQAGQNMFFERTAQGVETCFTIATRILLGEDATISDVVDALHDPEAAINEAFGRFIGDPRLNKISLVRNCGQFFYVPPKLEKDDQGNERQLPFSGFSAQVRSILASARSAWARYNDQIARRAFAAGGLNLNDFKTSKEPVSLFLTVDMNIAGDYQDVVELAVHAILRKLACAPRRRILAPFNEMCTCLPAKGAVSKLFVQYAPAARKSGLSMGFYVQSVEQARDWFPNQTDFDTIWNCCGIRIFFGGDSQPTNEFLKQEGDRFTSWSPHEATPHHTTGSHGELIYQGSTPTPRSAEGLDLITAPLLKDIADQGRSLVFVAKKKFPMLMPPQLRYDQIGCLRDRFDENRWVPKGDE